MGQAKQILIVETQMFKTLDIRLKNVFWRVSADTKTCLSGLFAGGLPSNSAITMAIGIITKSSKCSIKI